MSPGYSAWGWWMAEVLTVRFTYREGRARIIGAGYWRKKAYERAES